MALKEEALKTALIAIFSEMETSYMTNEKYAEKLAQAITAQIKTAGIPADSVIVSVGGGSGAPATGKPNSDEIRVE